MTVSIVVAQGSNRVIGAAGALPWHLPSDMRRFRELTMGHAVVMGRKTYESIPEKFRPLPGRRNLVISSNPSCAPGAEVYPNLPTALHACDGECFVIGGGQIYAEALALADRCYVTDIDHAPDGDTFFPELPATEWRCVEESGLLSDSGHSFVFRVYDRAAIRPDGGS